MKIYHFLYDHDRNPWVGGGAAARARELYSRLANRHDITVISGKYPGASDFTGGGVRYHFEGTSRDNYVLSTFCYASGAARFLREHRDVPDLVVEDFAPYNPIFSYRARPEAVLQLHQHEGSNILRKYLFLGLPFWALERSYPKRFRHVAVVSEQSRLKYGLPEGTPVIPNGFDGSYLSEDSADGGYLLFLGRLETDQKGLDILFQALRGLEGIRLKIAGKGRDEQKVREMLRRAGTKNSIEMLGFVEGRQKAEALRGCTAFVIPSRFEGNPLTVIEAAAFGKPVIASDIPELAHAVEGGFAVAFRSAHAIDLALKIKYIMDNPSIRKEMSARAREFARDYTWDRIAAHYEDFLTGIKSRDA